MNCHSAHLAWQAPQNAYNERYNRTVRHEGLGQYLSRTIEEVKDTATHWLWNYNHERPNMGLGCITLAQKLRWQVEVQPSVSSTPNPLQKTGDYHLSPEHHKQRLHRAGHSVNTSATGR